LILHAQAPAKGAPFIVSTEGLPEMVAKLNRVSTVFKAIANGCIAAGVVLVVWRVVDKGRLLWRRRKHRRVRSLTPHACSLSARFAGRHAFLLPWTCSQLLGPATFSTCSVLDIKER
jgi:hypothetical protein